MHPKRPLSRSPRAHDLYPKPTLGLFKLENPNTDITKSSLILLPDNGKLIMYTYQETPPLKPTLLGKYQSINFYKTKKEAEDAAKKEFPGKAFAIFTIEIPKDAYKVSDLKEPLETNVLEPSRATSAKVIKYVTLNSLFSLSPKNILELPTLSTPHSKSSPSKSNSK